MQFVCPRCDQPGRITWVHSQSFDAVCRPCLCRWRSGLPEIRQRVVILDTNAVSELMKIANPMYPAQRRQRVAPLWTVVLDRLRRGVQLKAVVCPTPTTLEREAILFQHGPAIEETAKLFNGEVSCTDNYAIIAQQLYFAAKAAAQRCPVTVLDRKDAYIGRLGEWSGLFRIEVNLGIEINDPVKVRAARDAVHASAAGVFDRWQRSSETLDQVYLHELKSFGPALAKRYLQHLQQMRDGTLPPMEMVQPSTVQMRSIREGLQEGGVPTDDLAVIGMAFAHSRPCAEIPANRIAAALYAYEARQIAGGMSRPKPSMWSDIELISTTLPYCDAMLVEGHFAEGVRQVRRLLPKECRETPVFSTRRLEEFVSYLDYQISAVPDDQRRAAERLYGYAPPQEG